LPTKVPMPTASSIDLVVAGIQGITNALQNPLANSPLAPLNDSQGTALQQLMVILQGTTKMNMPPLPVPASTVSALRVPLITTAPAAHLRVTPATLLDMVGNPGDNPILDIDPHLIPDEHMVVLLTNSRFPVPDLATSTPLWDTHHP